MFARRLYSSCSRSAPPVENAVKPHTPTRGRLRVKPSRISQSQTLSKLTRPRNNNVSAVHDFLRSLSSSQHGGELKGKGRKGRRTVSIASTSSAASSWSTRVVITDGKTVQIPFTAGKAVAGFTPVHLYPVPAALHLAFTPPHLPLPVNLGAQMYSSPPSAEASASASGSFDVESLFKPPPRPTPVSELSKSSDNILGDHQTVLSALSHPVNVHHLGQTSSSPSGTLRSEGDGDGDAVIARLISEAGVKWRLSSEAEWERTLARLSNPPASSVIESTETQEQGEVKASAVKHEQSVNEAVTGLEALLDKLSTEDAGVDMTSVKRKRKQKISKHKYKKRRKVSLASSGVPIYSIPSYHVFA